MPMFGVMREILEEEAESMRGVEDFFSVARTMPLAALMPREVTPWFTAVRAYSVVEVSGLVLSVWAAGCTYLHQLAAAVLSVCIPPMGNMQTYLGEKVVREKEYLSAILGLVCAV